MADGGDGFVGRCDVVEPRRGNRRWPDHVKARIVAESFQPGTRVVDVARRHGLIPHQLSDWRRHARQGLLAVPAEILAGLPAPQGPELQAQNAASGSSRRILTLLSPAEIVPDTQALETRNNDTPL